MWGVNLRAILRRLFIFITTEIDPVKRYFSLHHDSTTQIYQAIIIKGGRAMKLERFNCLCLISILVTASLAAQQSVKIEQVDLQPLIAQVKRILETMDYLGEPLSPADKQTLEKAFSESDAGRARAAIQDVLDKYCLA